MSKIFTDTQTGRFNDAVSIWENSTGETLNDAAKERILMQVFTAMLQNAGINHNIAYNENFLQNMSGDQLDAYGEHSGLSRNDSVASTATVRLDFSESFPGGLSIGQTIHANTVFNGANSTGTFTFKTTEDFYATEGSTFLDVIAEEFYLDGSGNVLNNGTSANDCEITALADASEYTFIDSVGSTADSSGGLDEEPDDNYRSRLRTAVNRFSTAGTEPAYRFFAKEVDPDIIDVKLTKDGWDIDLWILPKNYSTSTDYSALIAKVDAVFNPVTGFSSVRPLNDIVSVDVPDEVTYTINSVDVVVYDEKNIDTVRTQTLQTIDMWVANNKGQLGTDVVTSQLIGALSGSGIKQVTVDITGPVSGILSVVNNQIAVLTAPFDPADLTVTGATEI